MPHVLIFPLLLIALGVFLALLLRRAPLTNPQAGWLLAVFPFAAFLTLLIAYGQAHPQIFAVPWIPALGLNFSLYLDGLSALFGLIITGIGTLVLIYTGYYFDTPLTPAPLPAGEGRG